MLLECQVCLPFGSADCRCCLAAVAAVGAAAEISLADAAERRDFAQVRAPARTESRCQRGAGRRHDGAALGVHHDDAEAVRLLLKAGADAKAANRYGVTPLSLACTDGNTAIVELLLEAGADPNGTLPGGETALMTASRTGRSVRSRRCSRGARCRCAGTQGPDGADVGRG